MGVSTNAPVVVIVGGGFGGLAAAKALKRTAAQVVLIDRTNHHVFQPLLYQVATAVLTPGQIGSPIRGILVSGHQPNCDGGDGGSDRREPGRQVRSG